MPSALATGDYLALEMGSTLTASSCNPKQRPDDVEYSSDEHIGMGIQQSWAIESYNGKAP